MKLVAFAAAWIAGLLVGLEINVYLPALALFSLAALILACLFKSRGGSPWPALLLVVVFMGLIRVETANGPDFLEASDNLQPITVRGLVVSDPEMSGSAVEFTISVDARDRGDGLEEARGRVLVFARPTRELVQTKEKPYFHYGDRLELAGRLEEPPVLGNFDYRAYLSNQGIHSIIPFPQVRLLDEGGGNPAQGFIYGLRRKVSEGIRPSLARTTSLAGPGPSSWIAKPTPRGYHR